MEKEKRKEQSKQMKKDHHCRNLIGIAMLTGIWRGTVFIKGIAHRKNNGTIFQFRRRK